MLFPILFLITFFIFLSGVASLAHSIIYGLGRRKFLQKSTATVGTVTKFSFTGNGSWTTGVRFQTAIGQVFDNEFRTRVGFTTIRSVGDSVTVNYDPQNPNRIILGDRNAIAPWIRYFVSGGVGAVITVVGGFFLILVLTAKPAPSILPYITPDKADGNTQNATNGGEIRQCSERQNLKFIRAADAESVQLTVNNKSQNSVTVNLIGANYYQSSYETLAPTKSQTFRSPKRGEWWMITDATTGKCKLIVSPPNVVNVED